MKSTFRKGAALRMSRVALAFGAAFCVAGSALAQMPLKSPGNPIVGHIFAADPAAHVWPGDPDTLYIYATHDNPPPTHYDALADYHVFSTKDLVNWTDHGQVLSLKNVPWAASHAWAVDAVYHNGKYYLITCMKEKTTGVFMTGLAVSDRPEGPFKDAGFIKGTEWGQDPALFTDDDGQPYLVWGHDYIVYGAKLTKDLSAVIPESKVELTSQLPHSFEAPWINKINGKYYLSYAGIPGRKWPERIYYAVADSPLGPYKPGGMLIDTFPLAEATNHQSIVRFKDSWITFYHSAWGSGGRPNSRSLMADYLTIDAKGAFQPIVPTMTGVSGGKPVTSRILLEAENGTAAGGELIATRVASDLPGYSGRGYVTGFGIAPDKSEAFYAVQKACGSCVLRASVGSVKMLAQVGYDQRYKLRLRYAADQDTRLLVFVGTQKAEFPTPDVWVKASPQAFQTVELGEISLKAGDNLITLHTRANADIKVDAIELVPVY